MLSLVWNILSRSSACNTGVRGFANTIASYFTQQLCEPDKDAE